MILERLKWSVYEFLGIGCTWTLLADITPMLMTKYIVWFEEPLIGTLYLLGWSGRKPISVIEVEDMFDLRDLDMNGPQYRGPSEQSVLPARQQERSYEWRRSENAYLV